MTNNEDGDFKLMLAVCKRYIMPQERRYVIQRQKVPQSKI